MDNITWRCCSVYLILCASFFLPQLALAQIAINEDGSLPASTAMLDVSSTEKGMLLPRMTASNRQAISNPAEGLMVYDTDQDAFYFYANSSWNAFSNTKVSSICDEDSDTYVSTEVQDDVDYISFTVEGEEQLYLDDEKVYIDNAFYVGRNGFDDNSIYLESFPTINSSDFETEDNIDWQSFTVSKTIKLSHISMRFQTGASGTYSFSLFEGEGIKGTLIDDGYTLNPGTINWFPIVFSEDVDVFLERGKTYTLGFERNDYIAFDSLNPYPQFSSGKVFGRDYAIRIAGYPVNYNFAVADGEISSSYLDGEISTISSDLDALETSVTSLESSLESSLDEALAVLPIGSIHMWSATTAPDGWLICDGSTFSSSEYPDLNTHLGGTTLPDFSGRMPLAAGNSGTNGATSHALGDTGGEEETTLTVNQIPSHSHTIEFNNRSKSGSGTEVSDLTNTGDVGETDNAGGGEAHNNMPPYYTINFIIKAK